MAAWNRKRIAGWAAAVVLSIGIPVAIDQGYFRYNAYMLPIVGFVAALLYVWLILTGSSVSGRIRSFHRGFGVAHPSGYLLAAAAMGVGVILLLGTGEWYAIHKSLHHVAELRKADSSTSAPRLLTVSRPIPVPPSSTAEQTETLAPAAAMVSHPEASQLAKSESQPRTWQAEKQPLTKHAKGQPSDEVAAPSPAPKGITVGSDSVAMGNVPDGSKIGDRSVIVGATDAHGNTILNQGGLAVGNGAKADPTSVAIGSHANAGAVTVQPGAVASFGQQGGITTGRIDVNPRPAERTWEVPLAKCDEWVKRLNAIASSVDVSVGAFISNNDGNRVVRILAACLERSTWKPQMALLPVNPDGVEIGASESNLKLDAIELGLTDLGLRVTRRDIRPEYGNQIGIVIGTDPIKQHH